MSYELDDTQDPSTRWTVTSTLTTGAVTEATVVLDRARIGSVLVPPAPPQPPGCIPAIIAAPDLRAVDAGRELSTSVWVVSENEAEHLAALVMSPERHLPVFAFTGRDDDVLDGWVLLKGLVGIAHLVFVQSAASWLLNTPLPAGFNVYGGAARLWWSGVSATSIKWDHPLWPADVSARRITAEVLDGVVGAGLAVAATDERVVEAERLRTDRELGLLRERIAEMDQEVRVNFAEIEDTVRSYERDTAEALARARKAEWDPDYWRSQFDDLRRRRWCTSWRTTRSTPSCPRSSASATAGVRSLGLVPGSSRWVRDSLRAWISTVSGTDQRSSGLVPTS
jgi:hypothetical protein